MMMIYGLIPFMRQTLPYSELQQNADYRWPTNSRIGQRAAAQFLGVGDEKITLSGELRPEITGGAISLLTIKLLADEGPPGRLSAGTARSTGCTLLRVFQRPAAIFILTARPAKSCFH